MYTCCISLGQLLSAVTTTPSSKIVLQRPVRLTGSLETIEKVCGGTRFLPVYETVQRGIDNLEGSSAAALAGNHSTQWGEVPVSQGVGAAILCLPQACVHSLHIHCLPPANLACVSATLCVL